MEWWSENTSVQCVRCVQDKYAGERQIGNNEQQNNCWDSVLFQLLFQPLEYNHYK